MEWKDIERFEKKWNDRTKTLLNMLNKDENYMSILDIGCGVQFAKSYLNKKFPEIEYYGLDYAKRSEDTLICDLNKKEFPNEKFDVFLISGCLEYVIPIDWFFEQFVKCKKTALISYCSIELNPIKVVRENNAWKNSLSVIEIDKYMQKQGFILKAREIFKQKTDLLHYDRIDEV